MAQKVLGGAFHRSMARNRKWGLPNRKLRGSFTGKKKRRAREGSKSQGRRRRQRAGWGKYSFPTAGPKEGSLWSALPRALSLSFQRTLLGLVLLEKRREDLAKKIPPCCFRAETTRALRLGITSVSGLFT